MIYVQVARHRRFLRSSQHREAFRATIKQRCLRRIAALLGVEVRELIIEYNTLGKPVVRYLDECFHFSISYSSVFYAFAFSASFPLGIDIEASDVNRSRCFYSNIMNSSFSAREKEYLKKSFDINKFWLGWTIKEAYSKCTGLGLLTDFTKIEFLDGAVHVEIPRGAMGAISCIIFECVFLTLFFDLYNSKNDGIKKQSSFPFIVIDCSDRNCLPHCWPVC